MDNRADIDRVIEIAGNVIEGGKKSYDKLAIVGTKVVEKSKKAANYVLENSNGMESRDARASLVQSALPAALEHSMSTTTTLTTTAMEVLAGPGWKAGVRELGGNVALGVGGVVHGVIIGKTVYENWNEPDLVKKTAKGMSQAAGSIYFATWGATIGTAIFPGLGTFVGGGIGGMVGSWCGGQVTRKVIGK